MTRTRFFLWLLVIVFLLFGSNEFLSAAPTEQESTLTGTFTILWGDPKPDSGLSPTMNFYVADVRGNVTEVLLDEAIARGAGGVLALDRQRVTFIGTMIARPQGDTQPPLFRVQTIQSTETIASPSITGAQPWISIGCKFADISEEPQTLAYLQNMYKSNFPGLDHYWRELSYDNINLNGSNAAAWYTLPHPKAYYKNSDGSWNLGLTANECTEIADADIYFPNYTGINLMMNGEIGFAAWGSSGYPLTRDGITRTWRMAWFPPWGYWDIAVVEHEMGHGFGLPHSSGDYGSVYDNQWDVMSNLSANCDRSYDEVYHCLGQHTISQFKNRLGWLTSLIVNNNSQITLTLERLALPQTSNYKEVRIPIGPATHYYTLEVRRRVGYDVKLPGEGVIIHDVDEAYGLVAHVLDVDRNGNTGDDGAIWEPGESFTDHAHSIYVCVNSETASGYNVTIAKGAMPDCAIKPGAVTAVSTHVIGLDGTPSLIVRAGDWITYRGDYDADIPSAQSVEFSFEVTGPCGTFYSTNFVSQVEPGSGFVLAPGYFHIPDDVCLGEYTVNFQVAYNTTTSKSHVFSMLEFPTPSVTNTRTPTATFTPDGNWIFCAFENKTCTLPGARLARFGANGFYNYATFSNSFVCNSANFGGDPLPGVAKHCDYNVNPDDPSPTPTSTRTKVPSATFTPTQTPTVTWTPTATPTEPLTCTHKPAKPQLASPKDGALIRKGQATLKWQAVECAATYTVVIKDLATNKRIEKQAGLTTLEYKTTKLKSGHAYEWQVLAVNEFGRARSITRVFTTK